MASQMTFLGMGSCQLKVVQLVNAGFSEDVSCTWAKKDGLGAHEATLGRSYQAYCDDYLNPAFP